MPPNVSCITLDATAGDPARDNAVHRYYAMNKSFSEKPKLPENSLTAKMRGQIGADGLRLVRRRHGAAADHVGDQGRPFGFLPLCRRPPFEVVANRAARFDQ